MSYIALYRKWRPSVFEDVVEQQHVVKTLRYSISSGRIAHAYLFCGTRGTGKTTMAHILSRAINCLNPNNGDPCNKCEACTEILSGSSTDVLEMDAASNNSVDNVREIRDEVIYAPSLTKYKVYIIDEVHMLSTGAFNALLKTLEEPPAHVVFILATTEPHKLPATILSRCQRFDFRRITAESIMGRLTEITAAGNITLEKEAAKLIAKMSDGALRDAISLLDQCISLGKPVITYSDVLTVIGIVTDTFIATLTDDILGKNINSILASIDRLIMDGKDIAHFISDLIHYFRNLLICKVTSQPGEILDLPADVIDVMSRQCHNISRDEVIYMIKELSSLEASLKWVTNPRIMLEVTLVKLCENQTARVDGGILERLEALEKKISSGVLQVPVQSSAKPESGPVHSAGEKTPKQTREPEASPSPSPKHAARADYMPEWQKIMDELKGLGRRALHAYLIDTKAVRLSDALMGVVFNDNNKFSKTIVSKAEHIEVLEDTASRILGTPVKVKCIDEDTLGKEQVKAVSQPKDEFVEKARSIAEKAGVPFQVFDE